MLRKKLLSSNATEITEKKRQKVGLSQTEAEQNIPKELMPVAERILKIQLNLNELLRKTNYVKAPIKYVYNPLEYAFEPNKLYVEKYCSNGKKVVFLGMNPGPFGMCQTGVPFGTVDKVRDWLEIVAPVSRPEIQCPKRPIAGFDCPKSEVSGTRFWGLFAELCGTPDTFFEHSFVYNYCPLAFMREDGTNVTPVDIKDLTLRKSVEEPCNQAFLSIIEILQPSILVGIGAYTEEKVKKLFKSSQITNIKVLRMPHPSPRAPNNKNWPEKAKKFLADNDLMHFFGKSS